MSQIVRLIFDSEPISVLCQMGDFGCGDGGWPPVMKIDGNKVIIFYRVRLRWPAAIYWIGGTLF